MLQKNNTVVLFAWLFCSIVPAAGAENDDALFSIDSCGNGALQAGAYREALEKLRKSSAAADTAARLYKLAVVSLYSGDTARALSFFKAAPKNDTALKPLVWEAVGDLIVKRQPDSAFACYVKTLEAVVPPRYRSRIFNKISAIVGNDTSKLVSAAFWQDYAQWWNARRTFPDEPLCGLVDSLITLGEWLRIDSLVTHTLTALSDSVQCIIVKALDRALLSGTRLSDSVLSAASLFLLGRIAMDCGQFGIAERMLAASRGKSGFAAAVNDKVLLRFRGKLSFFKRKYEEAVTALTRCIRQFGYESDIGLLVARAYKNLDSIGKSAEWYDLFITHNPRYPAMAEILWRRAWIEEERGSAQGALKFYQRIFKYYPRSSRADESFVRHALCYYRMEKYRTALKAFTVFEAQNAESPFCAAACYWKAKCFMALDKLDSAKARFAELAQREPYDYYAHRARDFLALFGDSANARFSIDTVCNSDRALRWLDSAAAMSQKPLLSADSFNIRRGLLLAATGKAAEAEVFLEPVDLAYPGNLSLTFRLAAFYRSCGALPQASRTGRRLSWRIPAEYRKGIPLPIYELMYPLYYRDIITSESFQRNIDPCLVFAVIRQESVFNPDAVSSAGAIGLMQMMPSTGAALARELGKPFSIDTLYRPPANIRYGIFYLRKLLDQFNENEVLALASYNGGPPNAREWYVRNRDKDLDLFIEDIGFSETRNYVKRVLANYWFYRRLVRIVRIGPMH